jgi:hypothetical protein
MKCKIFYASGERGWVERMEKYIQDWLDQHPHIDIRQQTMAWSPGGNLTVILMYVEPEQVA